MQENADRTSALLAEAEQIILDNDYKQQLLTELLGNLKLPSEQITLTSSRDKTLTPLVSARAVIAERQRKCSGFSSGVEVGRHRRPLLLRGLVI